MAILNADVAKQYRSVFVSADRGIRSALERGGYGWLSNCIVTHVGLAQLVSLLIGQVPSPRGVASLLWMSNVSSESDRIRKYFVAKGLEEHDVGMALALHDVVNDISVDAANELSFRGIPVEADGDRRAELNNVLERYESDFFAKMEKEMRKFGEKSN